MSAIITKKQQKALAFRAKQKAKKSGHIGEDQQDVPEQDLPENETHDPSLTAEGSAEKRKLKVVNPERSANDDNKAGLRKKRKAAWDDEEEKEVGEETKSKKEIKQRFILFVGPYIS